MSAASMETKQFILWKPGYVDAVRKYFISENFQGAVQLTLGLLFVSLFVFVSALRFPGSCVAVLLYIVVAVTAAADNHVGTRIFLCGFMVGPMWLALSIGGVVSTLAKLSPDRTVHMILLCVLGPLAIIPFAIVRVGTSHLYLWAMGMVSALYVGMPIIAGFPLHDLGRLWMRAVVFILVAALVAMFAGSVLSMLVLPSLASHALEDEVVAALRQLGHHLSATTSHLFRQQQGTAPAAGAAAPGDLQGIHPLVFQHVPATQIAPGILDKELYNNVDAQDVYVALMDWFEAMSRPPGQQPPMFSGTLVMPCATCRTSTTSESGSTAAKSTFYGPKAAGIAAAVAAAAADSFTGWSDADFDIVEEGYPDQLAEEDTRFDTAPAPAQSPPKLVVGLSDSRTAAANPPSVAEGKSDKSLNLPQASQGPQGLPIQKPCVMGHMPGVQSMGSTPNLRLGSSAAAASFIAMRAKSAAAAAARAPAPPARSSDGSKPALKAVSKAHHVRGKGSAVLLPLAPSIDNVRQVLAHANRLLDAAAAEPQWLRGSARRFERGAWADVITKSQVLAMRLSGLDLVNRDHMVLMDASHSFPIGPDLEQLLKTVYASAAAVLALLADQIADRGAKEQGCNAATAVLQGPDWQQGRQQLMPLAEGLLVRYWQAVHDASPEAPVVLPRAHWVRQWMFLQLATIGVMEAAEALSKAAAAAMAGPGRPDCVMQTATKAQQQQQQQEQQLPKVAAGSTASAALDVEAGHAAAGPPASTAVAVATDDISGIVQQQQGVQPNGSVYAVNHAETVVAPAAGPPRAAAVAAAAVGKPSRAAELSSRLSSSWRKHTAWVAPWLPMALNTIQFQHLRVAFTQELPAMLSSKEAFYRQLSGRRFRAGLKYWFVLSAVMVSLLILLYYVPDSYLMAPNFGYSAAAVGMSDRVESTVHKVLIWVASSAVGAVIGWALMAQPGMANNPAALAAVIGCVCMVVGSLPRSGNTLVTLYTLMTIASMVLCQYTPACCTDTGSNMMAVMRAASVAAAAVFAVLVQNLVWPWYTSTWALEQLGIVYQEAADMLADLVREIYADTDALMQHSQSLTPAANASTGSCGKAAGDGLAAAGNSAVAAAKAHVVERLAMLDAAVARMQHQLEEQEQQQQQQHQQSASAFPGTAAASGKTGPNESSQVAAEPLSAAAAAQVAAFGTARPAGFLLDEADRGLLLHRDMDELLQQRQQQRQQKLGSRAGAAGGGGGGNVPPPSSLSQLQARLMKQLVQVKISLILDTTAWSKGLYATPPVVLRLLQAMFDVADALGALQQASSMPVEALSGTWYWTLAHMGQVYGDLLLEVMAMADATLQHVVKPTEASAAELLCKIQGVQHKRYEFLARSRDLRRLLHMAVASDEALFDSHMGQMSTWHMQGHVRYSSTVYTTNKVLDRMTAVARCALELSQKG